MKGAQSKVKWGAMGAANGAHGVNGGGGGSWGTPRPSHNYATEYYIIIQMFF